MAIKLLVDSASDIDEDMAKKMGIYLIPMEINFGDEQYLDGVNISHREFFNKLIETNIIPKTSQINEYRFEEKFQELVEDGSELLCITMSSKLSGTFNNAEAMAKKFDGRVQVVDSMTVTIGERILIDYAIRLIAKGMKLSEIVEELNRSKSSIQLIALIDTMKYLQKGGRISKATAIAGTLMNIKPVICVRDGEVQVIGKAMGSKKGNNLLMQEIEKFGGINYDMPFATGYSELSDAVLVKYLEDSSALWQDKTDFVPQYIIGSTIGTHAGPGAIAVSFFSNK